MKITNSNTVLKQTNNIELSIQFSLDGFSFCIQDNQSKAVLYFSEALFDERLNSPEELLKKITSAFKADAYLQKDFSKITVIHQNDLFTLVPKEYFDKNLLADYLKFNIKTLKTDFIAFDFIEQNESNNVYVPYVNINNFLFQNFGEFTYKHHLSCLIEKLIQKSTLEGLKVYVNVSTSQLDIIVLDKNRLLLANTFLYHSKEDFIYYILFIYEQLKLDTEKVPVYLMGKINIASELYQITFKYIRNLFFNTSKNQIFKNLELPNHDNFILLG